VDGKSIPTRHKVDLDASQQVAIEVPHYHDAPTELLMLQGKPIAEPVSKYGPFVMNTRQEIEQAFQDYQRTKFGGWPWPKDDHVFPQTKGRFALANGIETTPEQCAATGDTTK